MSIDQKVGEYAPKYRDILARAWSDEAFKARLEKDPKAVLAEQGIDLPAEKRVRLIEPAEGAQLLLLPPNSPDGATLLERMLAGQQAARYAGLVRRAWADPALKQRLLADPAAVLGLEGIELPADRPLRVVELAPNEVPFILPPPSGGAELSDDQLELVVGGTTEDQVRTAITLSTTITILKAVVSAML